MSSRSPKIHPALRFVAVGCALLWLSATSYCSIEHMVEGGHDQHIKVTAGTHRDATEQIPHEKGDAAQSHQGNERGQDSHHNDDQHGSCCSTLHATAQTPQLSTFGKSVFHPVAFFCVLLNSYDSVSVTQEHRFDRHANSREWVFTPEVCLGPAFRSHAPPLTV